MGLRRLEMQLSSAVGPRRFLAGVTTPNYLLYDNFTGPDGALVGHAMNVGPGWTNLNGVSLISANRATFTADTPGGDSNVAVTTCPKSDFYFACRVNFAAAAGVGLVVRCTDLQNFFLMRVGEATNSIPGVSIYSRVTGGYTQVASSASSPAPGWHTLKGSCRGPVLSLALDGSAPITYSSATFQQTATKVGLISDPASTLFDDFMVFP